MLLSEPVSGIRTETARYYYYFRDSSRSGPQGRGPARQRQPRERAAGGVGVPLVGVLGRLGEGGGVRVGWSGQGRRRLQRAVQPPSGSERNHTVHSHGLCLRPVQHYAYVVVRIFVFAGVCNSSGGCMACVRPVEQYVYACSVIVRRHQQTPVGVSDGGAEARQGAAKELRFHHAHIPKYFSDLAFVVLC